MQGHRPQEAFTPRIEEEFGKNEVAIVQYAPVSYTHLTLPTILRV